MYRLAAKRLLPALCRSTSHFQTSPVRLAAGITNPASFSAAAATRDSPNINHSHFDSSATSTAWKDEEGAHDSESRNLRDTPEPKTHWQEKQARVLHAALSHVIRLGWTDAAMIAGARDIGVSPSIVGAFPRKEAALVEYFMDDCLQRLVDIIDINEDLKNLISSQCVAKLVRIRLEMQSPYISKWPQALSIQAQPLNISTSFKQRAILVDEIWHAAGDETTDVDWYTKRTVLGAAYTATELYMLTDTSPGFQDTWDFLDGRIADISDLKKSFQEAKYLVEAVGAGMGGSVQGFMKRIFKG